MESKKFFSLIDKENGKEVYTSPCYLREDMETVDYEKVFDVFKFYFDRINSGIHQQLHSTKLPLEERMKLQYIGPDKYLISSKELFNQGGYSTKIYWTKNLSDFSRIKDYIYTPEEVK